MAGSIVAHGQRVIPPRRYAVSGLSAESHVIVQVEIVEPGLHVFASLAEIADAFREEFQGFHVTIWTAFILERTPLLNFPGATFGRGVFLDPRQHLAVAFASR